MTVSKSGPTFRHYELTHTLKTRRVYVASDDPKVVLQNVESYLKVILLGAGRVQKEISQYRIPRGSGQHGNT